MKISQNFVAFSEYMNFTITCQAIQQTKDFDCKLKKKQNQWFPQNVHLSLYLKCLASCSKEITEINKGLVFNGCVKNLEANVCFELYP